MARRMAGVWYCLALWALFVTEGSLGVGVQDGAVAMMEVEMSNFVGAKPAKQGSALNDALVKNTNKVLDDTRALEPAAAANLAADMAKDEQPLFPAGSKEAAMDKLQKRIIGDQAKVARAAKAAPVKLDKHGKIIAAKAPAEAQASYDAKKAAAAKTAEGKKGAATKSADKNKAAQVVKQLANAQAVQQALTQEKKSVTDTRSPNCKTCHAKCKSEKCRSWCQQKWCANEQNFDKAVADANERKAKQNAGKRKGARGPTVVNNIIKVYSHKTFYQQKNPAVAPTAARSAATTASDKELEMPDREPLTELERQEPEDKSTARIARANEERANGLIRHAETSNDPKDIERAEEAVNDVEKHRATDLQWFHENLKKKGATKARREYWKQKAMPATPNATMPAYARKLAKKEAASMAAVTKRLAALETAQANTVLEQQASAGAMAVAAANPEKAMLNAEAANQNADATKLAATVDELYARITNQKKVNGTWDQKSANMSYRSADAEIARSKAKEKMYKREMKTTVDTKSIKKKNSASIDAGVKAMDEMWLKFETKSPKKVAVKLPSGDSQEAIETSMAQRALRQLRVAADQISKHAEFAHRHAIRASRAASDTYAILGRPALYGKVNKSDYDATAGMAKTNSTSAEPMTEDQRVNKAKAEAEAAVQDLKVRKRAHKIIMKHEIKVKESGAKKDEKLKAALKKAADKKAAAKAKGKKATKKAAKKAKKILKQAEAKVAKKKAGAMKKAEGKGKGQGKKEKAKADGKAKAIKNEAAKKIKKLQAKAATKGQVSAKKAEKKADNAAQAAKDAAKEKDKSENMAQESSKALNQASTHKKSAVKKLHQIEQKVGTRDDPKHIVNAVDGAKVKADAKKESRAADSKAAAKAPNAATVTKKATRAKPKAAAPPVVKPKPAL